MYLRNNRIYPQKKTDVDQGGRVIYCRQRTGTKREQISGCEGSERRQKDEVRIMNGSKIVELVSYIKKTGRGGGGGSSLSGVMVMMMTKVCECVEVVGQGER